MPSDLKRYLDDLANGPLLDPVTKPGPFLYLFAQDDSAVSANLSKKRKTIHEAAQRAKPLVVPRKRRHKS